jgi:hypothetical protein
LQFLDHFNLRHLQHLPIPPRPVSMKQGTGGVD